MYLTLIYVRRVRFHVNIMNSVLCGDVQRHLFVTYANAYTPLIALACARWKELCGAAAAMHPLPHAQHENTINADYKGCAIRCCITPKPEHYHQLIQVAGEGRAALLTWVRSRRLSSVRGDWHGWLQHRIIEHAAKNGHDDVTRLLFAWWPYYYVINNSLRCAARGGHAQLVGICISRMDQLSNGMSAGHLAGLHSDAMRAAAAGGHEGLMRLYYTMGRVGSALCAAALHGHVHLMRICHDEWEATHADVENAMVEAADGGHECALRVCHDEWGAKAHLETAVLRAAQQGHAHIIRLCYHEWNTDASISANVIMTEAARAGQEHIVRLCHDELGALDVDAAMIAAAWAGHDDIMRMCHDQWHATNVNESMVAAARSGHLHSVRLCYLWGARDVNQALHWAAWGGHKHTMCVLHDELGATDIYEALVGAVTTRFRSLVEFIRDSWNATDEECIRIAEETHNSVGIVSAFYRVHNLLP